MERLTEWRGDRWIARQERLSDGTIVGDKAVYAKLAGYEDIGLSPKELQSLLHDGGITIAMRNQELTTALAQAESRLSELYHCPVCGMITRTMFEDEGMECPHCGNTYEPILDKQTE